MADAATSRGYKPTKFTGMSYEEGVAAALDWVLDETMPTPLEDE